MLIRRGFLGALVLVAVACGSADESTPDEETSQDADDAGSRRDSSVDDTETAPLDSGVKDAATKDSGVKDSGIDDASDGAVESDAGDSGTMDDGGDAGNDAGDVDGGGDGGGCSATTTPAEIVTPGTRTNLLLRGTIVTPDQVFEGEVLVTGDTITCVAAQCAGGDTIVDTHGIIFPGLIDTHNHILFDVFDETDWAPAMAYGNHNQWTNEARYGAMVDAKQYLNGESGSPISLGCEMDKYGELKGLVAGTTSIVGAANPTNKACYGTLARTIDQSPNGLGADKVQVATLFPDGTAATNVCSNFTAETTDAYLIHIAEGTDATALGEFAKLNTISTPQGCLYDSKTAIVHGTALGDPELTVMAQHDMSLVWSPRSNVFLYGAGTDLSKTTNIPLAVSKGINVALAPDWSLGGSQNLLDELRFANQVDDTQWGNILGAKTLVKMVTTNAARALGLGKVIGSLEVNKKADIMVIRGSSCDPYEALLASKPSDVRLVLVGGTVLYGDSALKSLGPASPGCEDLDICSASKFACVATTGGTSTNKFGQTFSDIRTTLSDALTQYDALNLTAWKFAPITPLVRCQ